MRINVRKFLFIGPKSLKSSFFEKAQEEGIIEFLDPKGKVSQTIDENQIQILEALKILRPIEISSEPQHVKGIDETMHTSQKVIECRDVLERAEESLRDLNAEADRLGVWGHFDLEELKKIAEFGKLKHFFLYTDDIRRVKNEMESGWFYISSQEGIHYFLFLGRDLPELDGFQVMKFEEDLSTVENKIKEKEEEYSRAQDTLKYLSAYQESLKEQLISYKNVHNVKTAEAYSQEALSSQLFRVEGWVSETKVDKLQELVDQFTLYADEIKIEEGETIPTHLENEGVHEVGEDLVGAYDIPSSEDSDPSAWVLWFFALFFGIIIGDGGYGLIFLAGALYAHYKFPGLTGIKCRMWKLSAILASSCVLWGLVSNSFFGMSFAPDHPIRKASLVHHLVEAKTSYHFTLQDDVYDYFLQKFPHLKTVDPSDTETIMMGASREKGNGISYDLVNEFSDSVLKELALLIGVVHLGLSMLRYVRRNWANAGWLLFMVGCYLHFPETLNATSFTHFYFGLDKAVTAKLGLEILLGGIGLSVFLALIQHRLMGLLEITTAIQVFSDGLSYLRLYALGLAGGMMAATFNDMASGMSLIPAIMVLVAGHGINIILGMMSGVIHGLRLNFLEWYHYSFEGGGRLHKPLKLIKLSK